MSFNNWKNHVHSQKDVKKAGIVREKGGYIPEEIYYVEKVEGNKIVRVPYTDENNGIYAEDFSIKSILDAGATDLLKPVGLLQGNNLEKIEQIENSLDNIANIADILKMNSTITTENVEKTETTEKINEE